MKMAVRIIPAAGGRKNGKIKHRKQQLPKGSSPTCPRCFKRCKSKVTDSRQSGDGIRRRRTCLSCGWRYTSYERIVNDDMDTVREWLSEKLLPHIEELFNNNKP